MAKFVTSRRSFLKMLGIGIAATAVPATLIADHATAIPPPEDREDAITSDEIWDLFDDLSRTMERSSVPPGARWLVVPPWLYDQMREEGLITGEQVDVYQGYGVWKDCPTVKWTAGKDGEASAGVQKGRF